MTESTAATRAVRRGALVLGMHRSGTSVVSGLLHRLGLDGGPREQMFAPDQFNSDGYWELKPLVELDDELLRRRGGFASAPPGADRSATTPPSRDRQEIVDFMDLLPEPWFMKDPRQCLLLRSWNDAIGTHQPAILVFRRPHDVIRSLRHRNGYSENLAAGLWEAYTRTLLSDLGDRPCHVVHYQELLDDPVGVTSGIASTLERTGVLGDATRRVEQASSLVRRRSDASSSSSTPAPENISPAQQDLAMFVDGLGGFSERLDTSGLPPASGLGDAELKRRRRKLRIVSTVLPTNPSVRSLLDRNGAARFWR